MTLDEVKAKFPIGLRVWSSGLACYGVVIGYNEGSTLLRPDYIRVSLDTTGIHWWCPTNKLYLNQQHEPVPEPEQHIPGISGEQIDHDAWKSFKDLL